MSARRFSLVLAVTLLVLPTAAPACIWDYDTLLMERQQFPTALELITGKFIRHSPDFYEWRIQDRQKKLQSDSDNIGYYDDLAVAYHKTGRHDQAIEIMHQKDRKKPGLYETEANLSVFWFYKGDIEKALEHVNRALAINPEAHFGREKYQKNLMEYVLARRDHGGKISLPLSEVKVKEARNGKLVGESFGEYLVPEDRRAFRNQEERLAAIKGILGMMRFADYDSPILLEALASLLAMDADYVGDDAKRLATRAYLMASYQVKEKETKAAYRELAQKAIMAQSSQGIVPMGEMLENIEKNLGQELAEAKTWYAQIENNEKTWIAQGKNPEVEFTRVYYREPAVSYSGEGEWLNGWGKYLIAAVVVVVVAGCLILMVLIVREGIRRIRLARKTG